MRKLIDWASTQYRLRILRDPQEIDFQRWHRDGGDQRLRFDYPLTENSVIFDVGGYKGAWSQAMFKRYGCRIYIFEPMPEFVAELERRFAGNQKVTICPYALAIYTGSVTFYDQGEGSSTLGNGGAPITLPARSITDVLAEVSGDVDLVKMNIEGGEFELLPSLLDHGIERVKFLTVQFHNFVPQALAKRDSIRRRLSRTHDEEWCYLFTWETWKRKAHVQAR